MMRHLIPLFTFLLICINPETSFPQPAFPGAEGFGANSIGGRGGIVFQVTNLNDDGPGSLRAAVEAKCPRVVVFSVSGTIALKSILTISNPYITIAGQTAPGGGICLKDNELEIKADHVIVRYIRSRAGDNVSNENHGFNVTAGKNIIIDHCSASWAVDEVLSVTTSGELSNVTIQWCMITESLHNSVHWKGPHGKGSLIRGSWGAKYSFHHNLYAHHNERNPAMGNYNDYDTDPDGLTFDFCNNVVYNWEKSPMGHSAGARGKTEINLTRNYYKSGPNSKGSYIWRGEVTHSRAFISKNFMNGEYPKDPWSLVTFTNDFSESQKKAFKLPTPVKVAFIKMDDSKTVYEHVLAGAGATLPQRDAVDTRIVNEVINGTGRIIDSEEEVGGWPELKSTDPPKDSDRDGIPDEWEKVHGLNPDDYFDTRGKNLSPEGYTNIEVYLNELVP
ncbi:polysaccharide lyase family 1 protein, partial [candidate division KSB1 bacterium]